MDQTKTNTSAPDFARQTTAPKEVANMPGNRGSTDPATDGGGSRGNSMPDLHREIIGK